MRALPPPIFQVGHLERVPLGTPYPGIVAHVGRLLGKLPRRNRARHRFYWRREARFSTCSSIPGSRRWACSSLAGRPRRSDGAICGVPKLTLVSRLQALLHEGRLKILRELAEAETLVRELQDFRVEFTRGRSSDLQRSLRQTRRSCSRARHRGVAGARRRHARLRRSSSITVSGRRARRPASRAILSVLTWANRATRQPSRWCAASIRQGRFRRIRNQSRTMRPARSSGRRSSGVEKTKLCRDDQSACQGRNALVPRQPAALSRASVFPFAKVLYGGAQTFLLPQCLLVTVPGTSLRARVECPHALSDDRAGDRHHLDIQIALGAAELRWLNLFGSAQRE